ncbi:hypothetical protein M3Y98_01183300 [Aphelenchoides besseyi]|nr:hypothetical protein M3Y98_01183300 [Aphelenchoides besseyi]
MFDAKRTHRKCKCRFLWCYELHGLSQVIWAKTWKARLFWITLIAVLFGVAIFTTYTTFSMYLERQTATVITRRKVNGLKFPTIVVCPKNPDSIDVQKVIREIRKKIPHLTPIEAGNLISFAIAGAGFHNMEPVILRFTSLKNQRLSSHFLRWKGNRSYKKVTWNPICSLNRILENPILPSKYILRLQEQKDSFANFYDDLFIKYGYKCEDLFRSCYIGYDKFKCCERFQHQYVMLRGKCFRLQDFYQTEPDIFGKLLLLIRVMPSPLVEVSGLQPQAVVFISDSFVDISTFPRFYINVNESQHVRLWARELQMLPWNEQCSADIKDQGRARCYVEKYHTSRVLLPFNCSLFYLSHRYPSYDVCDPLKVIYNYNVITNAAMNTVGQRCKPACHRTLIEFKFYKTDISRSFKIFDEKYFIFQGSYEDIEMEVYREIPTTTLQGFISELGGQSGLFLGFSIISLLNAFVSLSNYIYKRINERLNRESS